MSPDYANATTPLSFYRSMQRGASRRSCNFAEELLFEVDVNVNVLFRIARARARVQGSSGKCFSCRSLIVNFARFCSAALEGILLIDPEIQRRNVPSYPWERYANVFHRRQIGGKSLENFADFFENIQQSMRITRALVLAKIHITLLAWLFRGYYIAFCREVKHLYTRGTALLLLF